MTTITPTIGRKVWFHPSFEAEGDQPLDATVAFVHKDRDENDDFLINIGYRDMYGNTASCQRVRLWQGEEQDRPDLGEQYCEWMPYQKGQAAKEASAAVTASDKVADLLKK